MSKRIREGNKAVHAVRQKIQKKFFSDKMSMSMVETDKDKDEKAKTNLKVGEKFTDREGKVWYRTENGTIMNESRVGFYGTPMFCPKCEKIMGGKESRLNNQTWKRFGHCFDCQLTKEQKLRVEGKLDDYYEDNKKRNIESYARDMEELLMDAIMSKKDEEIKKVISSSEGDMQVWRGMGITDEEIEKFQNFIDKMRKKLGKDIETKNDKKDE